MGRGITGVALKQANGWTVGHAGQPRLVHRQERPVRRLVRTPSFSPSSATRRKRPPPYGINTESTYNWETEEWSVPINLTVCQIIKVSGKPVQLTGGVRYWADSPEGGADGWGARLAVTYLFPKKG